ncbi:MAG: XTP/dITP diphosphatase [Bacillota bacterium]|jgi:XTP/dITP diphosphohydrolase|nr:XTP/dITP diphosphatase [Bacillota bacterium]NLV64056.1 XTP/dITP diphosphatase [Clostridiaceae bacterium]
MKRKLIVASKNDGKIKEIKKILDGLPIEIISMKEAGIDPDIEENGADFEQNAMLKAQAVYNLTSSMVIADDSGLEIDFLNGAPGVFTSRFAGESTDQSEKNKKIIYLLKDIEPQYRKARFVCSIAFVSEKIKFTVTGSVEGQISEKPEGYNGFGYDPIFYVPEYAKTFAELTENVKNQISHRADALHKLRKKLDNIFS